MSPRANSPVASQQGGCRTSLVQDPDCGGLDGARDARPVGRDLAVDRAGRAMDAGHRSGGCSAGRPRDGRHEQPPAACWPRHPPPAASPPRASACRHARAHSSRRLWDVRDVFGRVRPGRVQVRADDSAAARDGHRGLRGGVQRPGPPVPRLDVGPCRTEQRRLLRRVRLADRLGAAGCGRGRSGRRRRSCRHPPRDCGRGPGGHRRRRRHRQPAAPGRRCLPRGSPSVQQELANNCTGLPLAGVQ